MKTDEQIRTAPQVVLARVKVRERERSNLWRADALNIPDGMQLVPALNQPFMNFEEARMVLGALLGVADHKKLKFMSFKGSRTYFPNETEFDKLLEPTGTVHDPNGPKRKIVGRDTTYLIPA